MKHVLIWFLLLISVSPVLAGSSGRPAGCQLISVSNPIEDDSEAPSTLSLTSAILGDILLGVGVAIALTSEIALIILGFVARGSKNKGDQTTGSVAAGIGITLLIVLVAIFVLLIAAILIILEALTQ